MAAHLSRRAGNDLYQGPLELACKMSLAWLQGYDRDDWDIDESSEYVTCHCHDLDDKTYICIDNEHSTTTSNCTHHHRSVGASSTIETYNEIKKKLLTTCSGSVQENVPEEGEEAEQVLRHIVKATKGGIHGVSSSGSFHAWVCGGTLPSALGADWLTSAWDQNSGLFISGPGVAIVEEIAGKWLKELLRLPSEASFAFTTGTQMAHFVALCSARYSVLKNSPAEWDVNEMGLCGAPQIRVIASEARHTSVDRAIRYIGLGMRSMVLIQVDNSGCICVESLKQELLKPYQPTIVILDAADLNIGAFDDFEEIIPLAKEVKAWVHIDGAFGLFARSNHAYDHLTKGIDMADSWATDCHKWLNTPYDCGVAFVRDKEVHIQAMRVQASYIEPSRARDQIDFNPEWSRRARGVPVYAALMELGRSGVAQIIEQTCRLCKKLVCGLGTLPGVQVIRIPQINQGLVRFTMLRAGATEHENDAFTVEMIEAINMEGVAYFSGTKWNGMRAMRISVCSYRTSDDDVDATINCVKSILKEKRKDVSTVNQTV